MNTENLRDHINTLLSELSRVTSNGGLQTDSNSQDVQLLRKKISELHDRLTVLEHLLQYPLPVQHTIVHEAVKQEAKSNPEQQIPVKRKDLKSAVGLNDRFRFVNELFGGNSPEFNTAVNQLESMESMEEAEDYLERLSGVYQWDKNGPAYEDFIQLVRGFFAA